MKRYRGRRLAKRTVARRWCAGLLHRQRPAGYAPLLGGNDISAAEVDEAAAHAPGGRGASGRACMR